MMYNLSDSILAEPRGDVGKSPTAVHIKKIDASRKMRWLIEA